MTTIHPALAVLDEMIEEAKRLHADSLAKGRGPACNIAHQRHKILLQARARISQALTEREEAKRREREAHRDGHEAYEEDMK